MKNEHINKLNKGFRPSELRNYLPEILVGGGWAPFLYNRYLPGDRRHDPVLTSDMDLMVRHDVLPAVTGL